MGNFPTSNSQIYLIVVSHWFYREGAPESVVPQKQGQEPRGEPETERSFSRALC